MTLSLVHRALLGSLVAILWSGCTTGGPVTRSDQSFQFALIGDVPYSDQDATNGFPRMIAEINRAPVAFVVHDGDIKAGAETCSEELLQRRYAQFQTFRQPFIYLFGDNEWTDCNPALSGASAEEWLARLRRTFSAGERSLGQATLALERQSSQPGFEEFRENVRWSRGSVLFAGFNIPGAVNNFGKPEFRARNAANVAWLRDAFAQARARSLNGVMLIIQANPRFDLGPTNQARAGFNEFLATLEKETVAWGKPVVLVHGDTHYFRIDKPMSHAGRRVGNFTRVETFGNPDIHWICATVDPRDPNLFRFEPRLVKGNLP